MVLIEIGTILNAFIVGTHIQTHVQATHISFRMENHCQMSICYSLLMMRWIIMWRSDLHSDARTLYYRSRKHESLKFYLHRTKTYGSHHHLHPYKQTSTQILTHILFADQLYNRLSAPWHCGNKLYYYGLLYSGGPGPCCPHLHIVLFVNKASLPIWSVLFSHSLPSEPESNRI